MIRGKSVNVFLTTGDINGIIKATVSNWQGVAFKIPRTLIDKAKARPELSFTGVYFLFGHDNESDRETVYIGQAGERVAGTGVLQRIIEHQTDRLRDDWTEAVAFVTKDNSLGATDITFLEHYFYKLACESKRYKVINGNTPMQGNVTEEKESDLLYFTDHASLILGVLGHKVFEPLFKAECEQPVVDDEPTLFLTFRNNGAYDARGKRTSDGFVIFKGSKIAERVAPSCPNSAKTLREKSKDIIVDFVLTDDVFASSASNAAAFVTGTSINGNTAWKTAEGKSINDLERESANNPGN